MLTVFKSRKIVELERDFPNVDIYVMSEEYARMERRLTEVTEEMLLQYLALFGYDGIRVEGEGAIMDRFRFLSRHVQKKGFHQNILCVTEYMETENSQASCGYYRIGIRDVLYELSRFSVFPDEIRLKLNCPEQFRNFLKRSIETLGEEGWRVAFADITPLSEYLSNEYHWVEYMEDIKGTYIPGEKIYVLKNGNLSKFHQFYNENKETAWIESRRRIHFLKKWCIELLIEYFRGKLGDHKVSMYFLTWDWAYNHPLFPQEKITSEQISKRNQYQLYKIRENLDKSVPFLEKIYGKKYSANYVKNIMDIPNTLKLDKGKIRHENHSSQYINVTSGERYTPGQPDDSRHTIYFLGSCVFFGYAVEDGETIAGYLQKKINTVYSDWRVVNMGVWGAGIESVYKNLYDMKLRKGDIVVAGYGAWMPFQENGKKYDVSASLNSSAMKEQPYFNVISHSNHKGYKIIADKLWTIIKDRVAETDDSDLGSFYLEPPVSRESVQEDPYYAQAAEYISKVKAETPKNWKEGVRGAIVMNCNPFTLGHQYLIRQSAAKVDYLYIFVVEEDKSFFPFKDRIELVKKGTQDIKNVIVVPSGKLIISSVTFPGYFLKDSPDSVGVDTSLDVDIFGKYIASPLGITKRFVGEEPIDMVTRSYNESMKEILPRYGIEVDEIKRKEKDGGVISASRVRKALQTSDFDSIRKLVPETTYEYLWENRERFIFSATEAKRNLTLKNV